MEVPTDAVSASGPDPDEPALIVTAPVFRPVSLIVDAWVAEYANGPLPESQKVTETTALPEVPTPVTVQVELAPGGPQESAGLPVLPLPSTMPSPAGAVVIVSICVPATWPAADAVIVGFPGVVDPYQNVTLLSPLGIVTLVTGAAAN